MLAGGLMVRPGRDHFLMLAFLGIIGGVGPYQAIRELQDGQSVQFLDLFRRVPDAASLRGFEKDLENQSFVGKAVRPNMQYMRFRLLQDAGDKAVAGRGNWLFYRPDVRFLIEDCPDDPVSKTGPQAAAEAIVSFRDQLARLGIQLVVVPVPGKPSVYPDKLTSRAVACDSRVQMHTRKVLELLAQAGVETVDLLEVFANARGGHDGSRTGGLYLATDTHWTQAGAMVAADAVARKVRALGWVEPGSIWYDVQPVLVRRTGDVLRMLKSPPVEAMFEPEVVNCQQVVRQDTREPYRDDPSSPVLVLGDSFLRMYERDEPGSAGLIAHLARNLQQPLASIVNDGGASTLVRQELARKSDLLEGKKLVIWEFVERDVRFGVEGWQDVTISRDRTLREATSR